MSPQQQAEAIASMARRQVPRWLAWGFWLLAAVLVVAGAQRAQGTAAPWWAVAGVAALLGGAAHQTRPHVAAAARALRGEGVAHKMDVHIEAEQWSDSASYHASVPAAPGMALPAWRFEFIPLGWKPRPGTFAATVHHLPGLPWPALVRLEQGLLYPRTKPRRTGD